MIKQIFYYENPRDTRIVKIDLDSIQEVAEGLGDERLVVDMDDDSFYAYCDILVDKGDN